MSEIKRYFQENYLENISSSKSHSERRNSFSINSKEKFTKILLEKGVFIDSNGSKCECVFLRDANDETFFLELKGRSSNVVKGLEQVMNSIVEVKKLVPLENDKIHGFIIGSRTSPNATASLNILKRKFRKSYKKKIVISTGNRYIHVIKS